MKNTYKIYLTFLIIIIIPGCNRNNINEFNQERGFTEREKERGNESIEGIKFKKQARQESRLDNMEYYAIPADSINTNNRTPARNRRNNNIGKNQEELDEGSLKIRITDTKDNSIKHIPFGGVFYVGVVQDDGDTAPTSEYEITFDYAEQLQSIYDEDEEGVPTTNRTERRARGFNNEQSSEIITRKISKEIEINSTLSEDNYYAIEVQANPGSIQGSVALYFRILMNEKEYLFRVSAYQEKKGNVTISTPSIKNLRLPGLTAYTSNENGGEEECIDLINGVRLELSVYSEISKEQEKILDEGMSQHPGMGYQLLANSAKDYTHIYYYHPESFDVNSNKRTSDISEADFSIDELTFIGDNIGLQEDVTLVKDLIKTVGVNSSQKAMLRKLGESKQRKIMVNDSVKVKLSGSISAKNFRIPVRILYPDRQDTSFIINDKSEKYESRIIPLDIRIRSSDNKDLCLQTKTTGQGTLFGKNKNGPNKFTVLFGACSSPTNQQEFSVQDFFRGSNGHNILALDTAVGNTRNSILTNKYPKVLISQGKAGGSILSSKSAFSRGIFADTINCLVLTSPNDTERVKYKKTSSLRFIRKFDNFLSQDSGLDFSKVNQECSVLANSKELSTQLVITDKEVEIGGDEGKRKLIRVKFANEQSICLTISGSENTNTNALKSAVYGAKTCYNENSDFYMPAGRRVGLFQYAEN